ncbi:hypothetical protein TanjilG_07122 [Lupinus angustifolius]|uniref:Uncharacterized protein n=1 Tax=Lupinus angustifolius TaxID=3871 RepID=A0A4P1QY01_LUPAN|nr:hypothetical protein TanjilG_07122 [Lupinus angustifolius]
MDHNNQPPLPPLPPRQVRLLRPFPNDHNNRPSLSVLPPPLRLLHLFPTDHNVRPSLPALPLPLSQRLLRIYNKDLPYQSNRYITVNNWSFPINISITNSIALYFTVTNNSITISTPLDVNNEPPQLQMHDLSHVNEVQNSHHPLLHGLTLPNLPTLPEYIKITTNNRTFDLLIKPETTIFLIDPSRPSAHHAGNGNDEVVDQPIRLPFTLTLFFNNDNDPRTVVVVTINISSHDIFIMAFSHPGTIGWAAALDSTPAPAPAPAPAPRA